MVKKGESISGRKFSSQEKGKDKMVDSRTTAPPPKRPRTHTGIQIGERRSPPTTPKQSYVRKSQSAVTPEKGLSKSRSRNDTHSKDFYNTAEEGDFLTKFSRRTLRKGKTVNFEFFSQENFSFMQWLQEWNLKSFLQTDEMMYDDLVRLFYFHLKSECGFYKSFVRGVEIRFTEEELAKIFNLPYYPVTDSLEKDLDEIDMEEVILFFTRNQAISRLQATFLTRDFINIDFKVLHLIVAHCLFPKAGGIDMVTLKDVKVMWCLVKGIPYCLVQDMISYMIGQKKRANGYLPYGMYLTLLFRHFKIDLRNETPIRTNAYDEIGIATLRRMRYKPYQGEWMLQKEIEDRKSAKGGRVAEPSNQNVSRNEEQISLEEVEATVCSERDVDRMEENRVDDHLAETETPFSLHSARNAEETVQTTTPSIHSTFTTTPTIPPPANFSTPSETCLHGKSQTPVSVDFSALQEFLETNFKLLTSQVGSLVTGLDSLRNDFTNYKNESTAAINSLQERVNALTSTMATGVPKVDHSLSSVQQQLDFTTSQIIESQKIMNSTLQDIRDNSDRICLKARLPSLQTLLQEIVDKKFPGIPTPPTHPFAQAPPHFQRTKPFHRSTSTGPSSSQTKPPTHVHIHGSSESSDSSDSSSNNSAKFHSRFPKEPQDPYEDRPSE